MVPFVGPSYHLNARKADVQRSVNLYPVLNEVEGGKTGAYLESIPGVVLFSDASSAMSIGWYDPVTSADADNADVTHEGVELNVNNGGNAAYGGVVANTDPGLAVVWSLVWEPVIPGDPEPTLTPLDAEFELMPAVIRDGEGFIVAVSNGIASVTATLDGVALIGRLQFALSQTVGQPAYYADREWTWHAI